MPFPDIVKETGGVIHQVDREQGILDPFYLQYNIGMVWYGHTVLYKIGQDFLERQY